METPERWTRERLEAVIAEYGGAEGVDLGDADLSHLDLNGMVLRGIILSRWDGEGQAWNGASLQEANLREANLREANLREANLREAYLSEADLGGANLREAYLSEANLVDADLGGANLVGANLSEANLSGADLVGVNLTIANLEGANLRGANLQGADLWGAELQEVNLVHANLQKASLQSANLQRADLVHVDLQKASLQSANLQRTDLRFANLRGVDLLDVGKGGLLGIRLYRAKLDHTVLRKEELGSAIGDEQVGEYRQARDAYLTLKQNFENLGDYEGANWAYIKERQMEKACSAPWRARRFYGEEQLGDTSDRKPPAYHPRVWWFYLRHIAKWLSDWLVELVCGYGERPWRTVVTMIIVFLVFVGLYWATGAVVKVEQMAAGTVRVPTYDPVDLMIFGLGAFTTVGPTGLEPAAPWVQLVTGIEALLGIGLTGLLGFVIGNRIRRS